MKKKTKMLRDQLPLLLIIFINIVLIFAVFFLMAHVENLLKNDVQANLMEIVNQNKDAITSRLMLKVNGLDLIADQMSARFKDVENITPEHLLQTIVDYYTRTGNQNVFIADLSGTAFFSNGVAFSIAGRNYFRLATTGYSNISESVVSRLNGEDIFIISVPITIQGNIVATLQETYRHEEMYNLCAISLFSSQGHMYIINSQGYIVISSQEDVGSRASENYFRKLYALGNPEQVRALERDITNNKSGFMETMEHGKKIFSAYKPIDNLHDWYLISCVETNAMAHNANLVIQLFYAILMAIVVIFCVSMLYFYHYKNKQKANVEHIAFVDIVTHGHTLNKFRTELRSTLDANSGKQYYILAFDIENFKYVNSYYGFDFGDKVLRQINESISSILHPGEMIARVSSDNFVVLLKDVSKSRLVEMKLQIEQIDGVSLYFSTGLYKITDPSVSVNLMIDKANTAVQYAKSSHKQDLTVYTEEFDQIINFNEQLKRRVEHALANHEFFVYYQPKVDMRTRALVGAEALVRWITPDGNVIPPAEFISLCENTGLIIKLDMCVFEQAMAFLRDNLLSGVRCVPISINFSRQHLSTPDFTRRIVEIIEAYGVPYELVEIELTETAFFDDYDTVMNFMRELHAYGVRISMDDFGSGYSCLSMLKTLPIDVVKIDRGFLDPSDNMDRQRIILAAVVLMASQLGIDLVAEGVETLENVSMMTELGCAVAQGYYFARPMPARDFSKILKEGKV